ncbi:MAG: prepilin-type N-terminal cleavage/methylation domain-containing protein [Patescibacteria group bacterium]|jgi:prepilin-type N-terminal cleavage/methylation domain-containing protein
MKKGTQGFTLIELLIVIAIIGILSGIGITKLNGAQDKARDAGRILDIRAIVQALQIYYSDHNAWPYVDQTYTYSPGVIICSQSATFTESRCNSYSICSSINIHGVPNSLNWVPLLGTKFASGHPPIDPIFKGTCPYGLISYAYRYTANRSQPVGDGADSFTLEFTLERRNDESGLGTFVSCISGASEKCVYVIHGDPDGSIW